MGSASVCASMAKRLCLDANETAELGGKVMKEAVASEVRNLAGHSAKAAREIKALISASDTRVEEGVRLVSQSGVLFEEIVVAIRKVNDMINEMG